MCGAPPSAQIDLFISLKVGRKGAEFCVCCSLPGLASFYFAHSVLRVPVASSWGSVRQKSADPRGGDSL